jgi:hypothetical protein
LWEKEENQNYKEITKTIEQKWDREIPRKEKDDSNNRRINLISSDLSRPKREDHTMRDLKSIESQRIRNQMFKRKREK